MVVSPISEEILRILKKENGRIYIIKSEVLGWMN